MSRRLILHMLAAAIVLNTMLLSVAAYKSSPHYGAGRRMPMDSIKTLTFYAGQKTAYRRTDPLPQLTCVGSKCKKFQPDVVQCTSMGNEQWKCSADLPPSIRLGRVEVSCEGYDYSEDPYVLKDSCALTYHLLPAFGPDEDARSYYSKGSGSGLGSLLFKILFWGVLGYIAYSFYQSLRSSNQRRISNGGGSDGPGFWGGGGGGPGGGWGSGWGQGNPPPPYSKDDSGTSGSSQTSWRPGFWTGLLGGLAAASINNNRGQRTYYPEPTYGQRRGFGGFGDGGYPRRRFDDDDNFGSSFTRAGPSSSSGGMRSSTGFGGTRNR